MQSNIPTKTVLKIAEKLANPDYIHKVSTAPKNTFFNKTTHPWNPFSLDFGYPALIIFFSEINAIFPDKLWVKARNHYTQTIIHELKSLGYHSISLSHGLTGIAYALWIASLKDESYKNLHTKIHHLLLCKFQTVTTPNVKKSGYTSYDLLCGICGYISYLLNFTHEPFSVELIKKFLTIIVQISGPLKIESQTVPGWLNPPDFFLDLPTEVAQEFLNLYPQGFFDLGVAHGISGYLSTLGKSLLCGIEVPKQVESILYIIDWLKNTRQSVASVPKVWPRRFGFNPSKSTIFESKCDFYFDGWSYGAPGIYNSILLAAKALKNEPLKRYCVKEFIQQIPRIKCYNYHKQLSFCYGAAGILSIAHQFLSLDKSEEISNLNDFLSHKIINEMDDSAPFGLKCIPLSVNPRTATPINNFGLISGVIGILLSLLMPYKNNNWPAIFMLR